MKWNWQGFVQGAGTPLLNYIDQQQKLAYQKALAEQKYGYDKGLLDMQIDKAYKLEDMRNARENAIWDKRLAQEDEKLKSAEERARQHEKTLLDLQDKREQRYINAQNSALDKINKKSEIEASKAESTKNGMMFGVDILGQTDLSIRDALDNPETQQSIFKEANIKGKNDPRYEQKVQNYIQRKTLDAISQHENSKDKNWKAGAWEAVYQNGLLKTKNDLKNEGKEDKFTLAAIDAVKGGASPKETVDNLKELETLLNPNKAQSGSTPYGPSQLLDSKGRGHDAYIKAGMDLFASIQGDESKYNDMLKQGLSKKFDDPSFKEAFKKGFQAARLSASSKKAADVYENSDLGVKDPNERFINTLEITAPQIRSAITPELDQQKLNAARSLYSRQ